MNWVCYRVAHCIALHCVGVFEGAQKLFSCTKWRVENDSSGARESSGTCQVGCQPTLRSKLNQEITQSYAWIHLLAENWVF